MAQWTSVERKGKGKGSLASRLRGRGFPSLAEACQARQLGPEAGAELSSLFKVLQEGGLPGSLGGGGGGAARPQQPPWRQGGGSPKPWQRQAAPSEGKAARTCFHCGMQGHIAKDCRLKQRPAAPTLFDWVSAELDQAKADKPAKQRPAAQKVAWVCAGCGTDHVNQDLDACRKCWAKRSEGPARVEAPSSFAEPTPPASAAPGAAGDLRPASGEGAVGDEEAAAALAALRAANFKDPAGFLRRMGISLSAVSVPVEDGKEDKDRAKALQRLAGVQKQLSRQRATAARLQEAINDAQKELSSTQKAVAILQQEYHKLVVEVGDQEDLELAPPGPGNSDKDLSPVLSSIRHLAQTLGNAERLDSEYHKYAAGQETPMTPAAWIAHAMSHHLGSLTNFSAAIGEGTGDYQLVKRRRADSP